MMKARPQPSSRRGFTLVEMMVVLVILGMVMIGLVQVLTTSRESYDQQKITLEMQQNARAGLEKLADDFRHVSYGKDPTQPSIHSAWRDSVTFIADIDPDTPGAEVIRYFLSSAGDPDTPNPNDTILMKTVSDSSGALLYSEPQSYGIRAPDGLTLRYFNGAGVELANNPVPQPELVGEILIEIVAVEPRAHKRTGTYQEQTLSTTIYPRNLPLTPARSRPSTPAVGSLSLPDCQSVTVPWATPTTNTDGTPLELGDISHFTVYFGTSSSDMSLYSRVARTINEWTVANLAGGHTYFLGISCTSRSGVESYMGLASIDLHSTLVPNAPDGFIAGGNPHGSGVLLQWSQVTEFTGGLVITTPVTYKIYRDVAAGVTPDPGLLIGTQVAQNWFADSTLTQCATHHYIVTATACGNESAASIEISLTTPAEPDCISNLSAYPTESVGELHVTWSPPSLRTDGSALPSEEISAYRIYYDTEPYSTATYVDASGGTSEHTLSGLESCTTYYINVAALDQCPHVGQLCGYNQIAVDTAEPCDPAPPVAVPFVRATGADQRIDIAWPANTVDCDLYGYLLYYGTSPGGPYHGTQAVQGPSPITFATPQVIDGDSCRVSLTGLSSCQGYSVVVSAIDTCSPFNESDPSPEAIATTECMACGIEAGCVAFMNSPTHDTDVRLELFTLSGAGDTVRSIMPHWSGAGSLREVWAGRPLVCVWKWDGTCGDGPAGPQSSGVELDVTDFEIPSSAREEDGLPVGLLFDDGMVGQTVTLDLRGSTGGLCSTEPRTVQNAIAFDDFDDGNLGDWDLQSGSWWVDGGELYQSSTATSCIALYSGSHTDFIFEAKIKCVYSQTPYILFRGNVATNSYYMFGLKTSENTVRLGRYLNGSYSTTASASVSLSNNVWYNLKVEVSGQTITAYLDCQPVLSITDSQMLPSGEIGLRTYASRAYYDDFRVYAFPEL